MLTPLRASLATVVVLNNVLLTSAAAAHDREIRVMCSGGFSAALQRLAPVFEKEGAHLTIIHGPSMGKTHDTIPSRLARGEACDVLVMVGSALNALHTKGYVEKSVTLADSRIGFVVKAGAPHPDISKDAALRKALLAAPSVAYSDSASGVYVSNTLFKRLGIVDQMEKKARQIQATPVAKVVAKGDVSVGLHQMSEILPVEGASLVGPIPEDVQKITPFSAAPCRHSANPEGGKALIRFLSSSKADPEIRATGLDPVHGGMKEMTHE